MWVGQRVKMFLVNLARKVGDMRKTQSAFKLGRRKLVKFLGLGVAVGGVLSVAAGRRLFAGQFLKEAPRTGKFDREYDPERQIMIDPKTREPVFQMAQGTRPDCPTWTAVVTPTDDGPKGDGHWDQC